MYGLRTAKEVRDSLAREHVISGDIKTLLLQVNTLVELAISEGNSHFTIHVPAEDYKKILQ
ncbi:hypothetical protein [Bacillus phage SPO1L4]|nr:hypothetical protein [Bacillus phage SPO1L4]